MRWTYLNSVLVEPVMSDRYDFTLHFLTALRSAPALYSSVLLSIHRTLSGTRAPATEASVGARVRLL